MKGTKDIPAEREVGRRKIQVGKKKLKSGRGSGGISFCPKQNPNFAWFRLKLAHFGGSC